MNFGLLIIAAIYFFLPAAFANMAPVLTKGMMKWVAIPVDFGLKYRGKRVFGDHKTLRGFVVGFLYALFIVAIQKWLYLDYPAMRSIAIVDYAGINVFLLAFLMGFGALFGDAIESFFKRQKGVEPGKAWIPFDQIDFVLGFLLFTLPFIPWLANRWIVAVILIVIVPFLHVLFTFIGYKLKLKKTWI